MTVKALLVPFFSQQDKATGLFRLDSDSGVKLYMYMARRMQMLGWDVQLVMPEPNRTINWPPTDGLSFVYAPIDTPSDNLRRRLHWCPEWLYNVTDGVDIVLTQHEFLAIPLRALRPDLLIVSECGMKPMQAWPQTAALFPLAWRASSLVACNSRQLEGLVQEHTPLTAVWQFGFAKHLRGMDVRAVDVVFPARGSATGYSNHRVFVEAMRNFDGAVRMTDPTGYLLISGEAPASWLPGGPLSQADYESWLCSSKVVVGLTDNGYGGWAFREAIAAGCLPVALNLPEYVDVLGHEWPYLCKNDAGSVRRAVLRALKDGWSSEFAKTRVRKCNDSALYGEAWKVAEHDLMELLR